MGKKTNSSWTYIWGTVVFIVIAAIVGWFGWLALQSGEGGIGTGIVLLFFLMPLAVAYAIRDIRRAWKARRRSRDGVR
jgi:hypothetical protein